MSNPKRFRIEITGNVQGVGFRPFVYRLALRKNLSGFVCNNLQGVTIEVEGEQQQTQVFMQEIMVNPPRNAAIERFCHKEIPILMQNELFKIIDSQLVGSIQNIPPDLPTCEECVEEIFNPKNRRYLYPFTNCTYCGPRFTIIKKLPYDRQNTSMSSFVMCSLCQSEYENPENRRFHAQPIACSNCGPHLEFIDNNNNVLFSRHKAMIEACRKIKQGFIVAIKGLGGFQLVVDAKNENAINQLRIKKTRKAKPFAVMYPNIEKVKEDCFITAEEISVLHYPSPIVLLKKHSNYSLAPGVSGQSSCLGVMIPYTPLHHIMMKELNSPVIVTSGNKENDPICICEKDAIQSLSTIADFFLIHNRSIVRHADDSVVKVTPFAPYTSTIWRSARGYSPTKIHFPKSEKQYTQKIVATGAQQKNSVAFFYNNQIMLSQYIGDLVFHDTYRKFENTVDDFQQLLGITPDILVTDKHPNYENHRFPEKQNIHSVSVQHHYTHILSTITEHNVQQPLLGIAWDGTGFGEDSTIWGGEFLKITKTYFERFAYFLPFSLLGGEKAIKEPRRIALALLYKAFGEEVFTWENFYCVSSFTTTERKIFNLMLDKKINCPQTSSIGRIFDGIASLLDICHINIYEGEAAMKLEACAGEKTMSYYQEYYPYSYELDTKIINWIPIIKKIVLDIKNKENPGTISKKFHNTLTKIIIDACNDFCSVHKYKESDLNVVLGGGCFQNHTLLQSIHQYYGSSLYYPQKIPCNDNGIAVGQIIAALRMQSKNQERL